MTGDEGDRKGPQIPQGIRNSWNSLPGARPDGRSPRAEIKQPKPALEAIRQRVSYLDEDIQDAHRQIDRTIPGSTAHLAIDNMYARICHTVPQIQTTEGLHLFYDEYRHFMMGTLIRNPADDDDDNDQFTSIVDHPLRLAGAVAMASDILINSTTLDERDRLERRAAGSGFNPPIGLESYIARQTDPSNSVPALGERQSEVTQQTAESLLERFGDTYAAQFLSSLALVPYAVDNSLWGMKMYRDVTAAFGEHGDQSTTAERQEEQRVFGLFLEELDIASKVFCTRFSNPKDTALMINNARKGSSWGRLFESALRPFAGGRAHGGGLAKHEIFLVDPNTQKPFPVLRKPS